MVPIYNVERYLHDCLESVVRQTVEDFEVIMVDDGSTDGSAAIAQQYAAADPRFRLISQPNGGLGNARNTGAAAATGEYLVFLDSDDALPRTAYALLLGALEQSGSDFATGNVHRLTPMGTHQARFLARTFERTRLKTHVKRFRPLLADRIVPNKLWRRSFWEEHGLRFPEGVLHEDIPVVVPAHFMARSVDVVSEPVYYYRIREGGSEDLSITQRRAERRALEDRLDAVEHVSRFLAQKRDRRGKRWYDASVVADDLRYYLNVLDLADDEYRAVFMERVNAFLDGVGSHAYRRVPSIDRLKWHLVRRRLLRELLEVLRFQKEELEDTPPVRKGRHWYGDFPFREDERLKIPRRVYQLDHDFTIASRIDDLRWDGSALELSGWVFIPGIGAPERDTQRVAVKALRPGRLQRVRLRLPTSGVRLRTTPTHRPDVTGIAQQRTSDLAWSGFSATLDPRRLRRLGRWREGTWELYVTVQAGSARRRRWRFVFNPVRPLRAVELPAPDGVAIRAAPTPTAEVAVHVRKHRATIVEARMVDGVLELEGKLHAPAGDESKLRFLRPDRSSRHDVALEVQGGRFTARVAPSDLPSHVEPLFDPHSGEREDGIHWEIYLAAGDSRRQRVELATGTREAVWERGDEEIALVRTVQGDASLVIRSARATITAARWSEDGDLDVEGVARLPGGGAAELLLVAGIDLAQRAFPVDIDPATGRFAARLTPARIPTLAGVLPIGRGRWEVALRRAGAEDRGTPVMLDEGLYEQLPLTTVVNHKPFNLGVTEGGHALLVVERDHEPDERGPYHQRRLRETVYAARRTEPLRDAVVYSSFRGRQYSDNPRAIHSELVRRGVALEHLWVVRDGMYRVPDGATALREGSREHLDALATARFVVDNDHFPEWFTRRPDQVCLQTWHGTPLKRLGFDVSEIQGTVRSFGRNWDEQVDNWQYVLSPNRFSTPILRKAYAIHGEMLETGYPRNDALAGADREAATRALRTRLGLPEGKRVVLYAPTYRDHVIDNRGRYRLDLHLDIGALRRAVGDDTIVLFRKHHYIADAVPTTSDGFVRDVSSYPDGTELMLAADVLVTDYSSMMFDFANTGRPMLFFTYDLDTYEEEIRGFYFDFAAKSPGPLLRTTAQLAEALRDLEGMRAEYEPRYREFRDTFCELDDGGAAARVVDRVFAGV